MAHWRVAPAGGSRAAELAAALGLEMPAARVLASRGFDLETARQFLNPSLDSLIDPFLLRDMDAAVKRLRRAIDAGEKILIYGDYDVDGATSVVILKKAIELAGGTATFFIPHRLKDGYGMRPEIVRDAAAAGVRLIVSVDTGIRAAEVVRLAGELGMDVIVTDHHLPEAELPPAAAVLNPNRPDCSYPDKGLCGAGVTFKLVQALLGTLGWPQEKLRRVTESFLKLVAIGTVADVVPLTGENRVIVKHGLEGLRQVRNPGLRALLDTAGFTGGAAPTATQVAFRIAPRINAAGRMDSALAAIELFLTTDAARARELAERLHELNQERQAAEEEIVKRILEECLREPVEGRFALVFCGEGWHRGVLGIAASRVVERFHRPAFVLSSEDGRVNGSGRGIPGFHLLEALESMPELFERFGGHVAAAGVTLREENLESFRERFNAYAAARLRAEDLVAQLEVDAPVELRELSDDAVAQVRSLAPFGCGNPAPLFAAFGVELAVAAPLGDKHLRMTVRQNGRTLPLKAWKMGERLPELSPGMQLDVAFSLEDDAWSAARGGSPWCAILKDWRSASQTQEATA